MISLSSDTFKRPSDMTDRNNPEALYIRSYLLIRTLAGSFGLLLPFVFIAGEAYFLRNGVHFRGSLSAYYHTSMRDIFVGSLCATGLLLATYMSGKPRSWDFVLSLVAGVAVIGVALIPTQRPGLANDAPRCGALPEPAGCAAVQQQFGERPVAIVHFACAAVFILSLAAISFLFAHREQKYENDIMMTRVQRVCGIVILLAFAWAAVGGLLKVTVWELTPLYLGEVISVWSFGVSWLLKGIDLRRMLLRSGRNPAPRAGVDREDERV